MKSDLLNLLFMLHVRIVSSALSGDLHLSGRLCKAKAAALPRRRSFRLLPFLSSPAFLLCHLPPPCSTDGQIWESGELRRRRPLLHRVRERHGARSAGGQVAVHHVLRDGGAHQVRINDRKKPTGVRKCLTFTRTAQHSQQHQHLKYCKRS